MSEVKEPREVVLIGGGIMSATLGILLKKLDPSVNITIFEKLSGLAMESTDAWNNAGTGHAALCELNYTNENPDGTMDVSKALKVNEQFNVSRQFWASLVKEGLIENPAEFIRSVPHMSFVIGKKNIEFLRKRYEVLKQYPTFKEIEFTTDNVTLSQWVPLMMVDRDNKEEVAATKMEQGTDVNFGALSRKLFKNLEEQGVKIFTGHKVEDLKRNSDGTWQIKVKDLNANAQSFVTADFVFVGAGGNALPLLQKTGILESKHIGGFPVSGLFLKSKNEDLAVAHSAKVYGKAKVGAPPMSVPHLDTRYIDGKTEILFGPFAGFSPKFLKTGKMLDLPLSVKTYNLTTMLAAGMKEMGLTKYLIQQLMLSHRQRMDDLREFIPSAKDDEWEIVKAGQRVQVIKDTQDKGKGTLQFGTELITSEDGTISALLGASPGASVAISVMLELVGKCFPELIETNEDKIKEMIPSYGQNLYENEELFKQVMEYSAKELRLTK
ncbi:malate dehydrogenase (quinone) [Aliicoccus persicus]|uniref:Probable malate:quinone oxidoreductase n=1 Tax=Aliicoccus persicus TaxID=930138 RepID=A0A662Z2K3_9STAP|nr:malate dehydrogenase (quinone) [Aliicoccus persicus]SEV95376.1 malate dehydrogenase (quinone) [Aliicoccus persicus]